MTTALNDVVVVEPCGLIKACAWCVSRGRLDELGRKYVVSHAMCTVCAVKFVGQAPA